MMNIVGMINLYIYYHSTVGDIAGEKSRISSSCAGGNKQEDARGNQKSAHCVMKSN
jgi:hypothetical protein